MDEVVTSEPDGVLRYDGQRWIPVAPLTFRVANGSQELKFQKDSSGRVQFMDQSAERITWYQSGRAAVALYLGFMVLCVCALIVHRSTASTRPLCVTAIFILAHSIGWLAVALAADPPHLILGLPWYLWCALTIGTIVPFVRVYLVIVTARAALNKAWRTSVLVWSTVGAVALAFYIPFEFYWPIMLWPFASIRY